MSDVLKGKRLLIVDDEPDLREMLEFEFEMSGASVETAMNGRDALEKFKHQAFDLIISDIRMPGGDGVELIKNLNSQNIQVPLIFISGFADIQVDEAYELGASGYFTKPFVLQEIVNKVAELTKNVNERWGKETILLESAVSFEKIFPSFESELVEFGRGGIMLTQLEKMPRIDTDIHFKLNFEKEDISLEGVGKVKWVKKLKGEMGTCVGLDISNLSKDSVSPWINYLETFCPSAYIPKAKA